MQPRHTQENPGQRFATGDSRETERIYHDWHATLESPLVPHLMGKERGICQGHGELREFFKVVAQRKPKLRQYFRPGYFTDCSTLIFEYPRNAPEGEQMDFAEVINAENGSIKAHKVYWGLRGFLVMLRDEYHV